VYSLAAFNVSMFIGWFCSTRCQTVCYQVSL